MNRYVRRMVRSLPHRAVLIAPLVFWGFAACKKTNPPVAAKSPAGPGTHKYADIRENPEFAKLSPRLQASLLEVQAQSPYDEAQAVEDRREMVRPARAGFKPDPADKKIKMTLTAQKTMIRKGDFLWYVLELQNVGSKPIRITEPYFKGTGIDSHNIKFRMVFPNGNVGGPTRPIVFDDLPCPGLKLYSNLGEDLAKDAQLSPAVQDGIRQGMAMGKMDVTLQPGETLAARPWGYVSPSEACARYHRGEEPHPRPDGPYRQFWVDSMFKVGSYRIKAVFDDLPRPPSEESIQTMIKKYGHTRDEEMKDYQRRLGKALGHWESNEIRVEVVP